MSLSPTVFNLCQDFVLKQIAEMEVFSIHVFKTQKNIENITVVGFNNDTTTIITKDLTSVTTLVIIAKDLFSTVGMQINPTVSVIIKIDKDSTKNVTLLDNLVIPPVEGCINNCIKYLEVNFNDEIVFDGKRFFSQLEKDFRNVVTSLLLLET